MSGARIRSVTFKAGYAADSLTNAITGQGTSADWRRANVYQSCRLTQYQIASAYDGSGLMGKVIDIPALDKVRAWRDWQADKDQITLLEAEEKRLGLRQKIRLAEVYRGLGGGALILGLPGDPTQPAPNVGKSAIAYIHVVSRFKLDIGRLIEDYRDPNYNKPERYRLSTTGGQIDLHPSRVIAFPGDPVADVIGMTDEDRFWGKSRIERMMEAVQNSDSANGAFAGLVAKVRNTVIKIPGLMDIVSTTEGEAALRRRLTAMVMGESLYNASLMDAGTGGDNPGEDVLFNQVNWAGIPDIMMAMAQFVSGLSDIPMTRLLGTSPAGMNATGESDMANWNKMIRAGQEIELSPCIDELDRHLIPSALGSRPPEIFYEWAPLDVPTEKEQADTFAVFMGAAEKLQLTAAIPERAFSEALQNALIERGYMPGLEGALESIPESERYGVSAEPDDDGSDPSELQASGKEADPTSARNGGPSPRSATGATDAATWLADAKPRPLYVSRQLLNAPALIAWARANGFATTLPADDMHVTILYSRNEVDPLRMGRDWREDDKGRVTVRPGGPRVIERLGENAVVLSFASPDLVYRHKDMIEAGGSHDYPSYQPHITVSYEIPGGVDLDALKPFNGELVFGPERFEALDLDWKSKVREV